MWGIIVFIFGVAALVKGQFYLTRNRVVGRTPARVIGLLLMLPLPLHFLTRFLWELILGAPEVRGELGIGDLVTIASIWIPIFLALGIAIVKAQPVKKRKLPPDQPYFDEKGIASSSLPDGGRKEDRIRPPDDEGLRQ